MREARPSASRRCAALPCLALVLAAFLWGASSSSAWDQDICVSFSADSIDVVKLVVDPVDADHLWALLTRNTPPAEGVIMVSRDGGASWTTLCALDQPPLGRGGIDMCLAPGLLCVAQTWIDVASTSLVATTYESSTGVLQQSITLIDGLASGGDVSLCNDQEIGIGAKHLYLSAVVDYGDGGMLFFARSITGGATWEQQVDLAWGDIGGIHVASSPESEGHLLLTFIRDGLLWILWNSECGHSEYWGEMFWGVGGAVPGSRPAAAGRGQIALMAAEAPGGDVEYYYSPDAGHTWLLGGMLASSPNYEGAPVFAVDPRGTYHLLYTDFGEGQTYHRTTMTPDWPPSWSAPSPVSDGAAWTGPETTHLEAFLDMGGGAATLHVDAVDRIAYFDAQPHPHAEAPDDDPVPGGGGLRLVGPNPTRGEVRFAPAAECGGLRIEILDSTGRIVRRVSADRWDGCDHHQRPVPPGAYFARPEGRGQGVRFLIVR